MTCGSKVGDSSKLFLKTHYLLRLDKRIPRLEWCTFCPLTLFVTDRSLSQDVANAPHITNSSDSYGDVH